MGGISIPALSATAISGVGSIIVYASNATGQAQQAGANSAAQSAIANLDTPFRPPQWGQPALTMVTVPAAYIQSSAANAYAANNGGATVDGAYTMTAGVTNSATTPNTQAQYLVFDGVMRASHSQPMTMTEHPIQDSANATDHIRANQAIITMDVLMTDVLPAFAAGQWTGNPSKSISCFETLDALRLSRVPLTLTTRLKTYSPVFIMNVIPDETVKTRYGLRCRVEFKQGFLFQVATSSTNSARTQTTGSTAIGQIQPQPIPAGVTAQNGLPSSSTGALSSSSYQAQTGTVIGAGNWSSNNAGGLVIP